MGDVIKVDYGEVKVQIAHVLEAAYKSDGGFSASAGLLKENTQIKISNWGTGYVSCGNVRSNIYIDPAKLEEFGAIFHVLSTELTGINLEIYPDREGNIAVEGEITRTVGGAVVVSAGGKIQFDTLELIKLIPGMPRAMKALDGKAREKRILGFVDCVATASMSEAQCKAINGMN
jgi:hypothetical protein